VSGAEATSPSGRTGTDRRRIIVGLSGGSGPILGARLLEELRKTGDVETHLIASVAAIRTLDLENPEWTWERVQSLADHVHDNRDIAAGPASGSFRHDGMAIVPCSMNTAGSLAHGVCGNLLLRAADVTLKERRNLILVPRETPLHLGHLRTLATLAELGACIIPPMIAMYVAPKSVDDLLDYVLGKILDQLGFPHDLHPRWREPQ
jgi:4-hydroxy-3-polyprenylbenzoate decarboxylase